MVLVATANVASGRGRAASSSVSTEIPANDVPSLDQVVTQWMSPLYTDRGSCWTSFQVHVSGGSTRPWTVIVHVVEVDPGRQLGREDRPVRAHVVLSWGKAAGLGDPAPPGEAP